MHGKLLAIIICLLALAALHQGALAQCTDSDGDGFFYQSGCGISADCNDAAPGVHPGALELCDGSDNDCDGMIDNDPACVTICPAPYEVFGDHAEIAATCPYQHSLVWTGSEFGVAWSENSTGDYRVHFSRLDAEGNKIGGDTELSLGNRPTIVWTGSEYAVAYGLYQTGIFLQRLDASGTPIGAAEHLTQSGSSSPSLAWTGSEFGLAWRSDGIYFKRLDATGQEIPGSQVTVSRTDLIMPEHALPPDLAWSGDGFGLAYGLTELWEAVAYWLDFAYFQALDSSGNLVGDPLRFSENPSDRDSALEPSIAWSGSEFALAWHDLSDILFARVDSSGNQIGSTIIVFGPASVQVIWPDIAWTGGEYSLAWSWYIRNEGYQVYLIRLDPSGAEIGNLLQVTDVYETGQPALVWTGEEYGILWPGNLTETDECRLYFTRLACGPCLDHDGDDFAVCDECDDGDDSIYPGAPQLCDGVNNDCDDASWPEVPADEIDADSDSYRPCSGDCDESDPARSPGAVELCDGIDNNCSGEADDADLDSDRARDCVDNCPGAFNPMQSDPDSDGIGALCDLCPFVPDPDQADMDGDGRGDACDCQPIDPGDREPAEVTGLRVEPYGEDSWMLEWAAVPGADAYSISRGDLAMLGHNSYGDCLVEGVFALSYEDSSIPDPGDYWFYLVQGQNFDCGLGPLGRTSDELPRENPSGGACGGHPNADLYAAGESTSYGTVSGSYTDTHASDDIRESIEEELSSGNPESRYSRLGQRWTFDLTPGSRIEFHIEGYRTASSDGDDFQFEYSTDGGANWNPIALAHLPLADYGSDSVADLPAGLSGPLIFRVIDTDRTAGNQVLDTVYIDELFVRVIP